MMGGMQEWDLRVSGLIDHAARAHPTRAIVDHAADGAVTRTTWAQLRRDALRMVQALRRLDIYPEDRVATLATNHARHLVSGFGVTGAGCVLHPLDPSLSDDRLVQIVEQAGDRVLIYDARFHPVVERLRRRWPTIEHYVCFDDPRHAVTFADWIAAEDGEATWSMGDERDPCLLCHRGDGSGGVLHSHRSQVLQALAMLQPACLALAPRSVVLPVASMFHDEGWALPWAGAATGAKMVFAPSGDPAMVCALIAAESVTHVAGEAGFWSVMAGQALPSFDLAVSGGAALASGVVERLMRAGLRVVQMRGASGTVTCEPPEWDTMTFAQQVACASGEGRPPYGREVRLASLSDASREVAHDGVTQGALQVRGHWTVSRHFAAEEGATDADGWFDTGDIAAIGPDGAVYFSPNRPMTAPSI